MQHKRGEDAILLARQMGIKDGTARAILRKAIIAGEAIDLPHVGPHNTKVAEDMRKAVEDIISENCTLSLKEINLKLQQRLPEAPKVSLKTIERILDGLFYTLKKVTILPFERNSQSVEDLRREYAEWFLKDGTLVENHVFIDETGFNVWTKRGKGRSKKGTPATVVTSGQRGQNITLILAISPQLGVVHHTFHDGGVNADVFTKFMQDLSAKLASKKAVMIFDNANCHSCSPESLPTIHSLKKLPPLSPMLNPIEEVFSLWKREIKGKLADHDVRQELLDIVDGRQITLTEWRRNILKREGEIALNVITPEKCMQLYNHSFHFLYKCLTDADM